MAPESSIHAAVVMKCKKQVALWWSGMREEVLYLDRSPCAPLTLESAAAFPFRWRPIRLCHIQVSIWTLLESLCLTWGLSTQSNLTNAGKKIWRTRRNLLWFQCNFKPNECLVSELLLNVCPVSWCTAQQMQKLNVWHCNWGPLCNCSWTTLNAWLCFFALYPKFLLWVRHAFCEYKSSKIIKNCSKCFFSSYFCLTLTFYTVELSVFNKRSIIF